MSMIRFAAAELPRISVASGSGASSSAGTAHASQVFKGSASGAGTSSGAANAVRILKGITSGAGTSSGTANAVRVLKGATSGTSASSGTAKSYIPARAVGAGVSFGSVRTSDNIASASGSSSSGVSSTPIFRAASTAQSSTPTITIGPPAGTIPGDLLIAFVLVENGTLVSSGWVVSRTQSLVSGTRTLYLLRRRVTGTEPSIYSFSTTTGSKSSIVILNYSNAVQNDLGSIQLRDGSAGSTLFQDATLNPDEAGQMILGGFGVIPNASPTAFSPAGRASAGFGVGLALYTADVVSTGTSSQSVADTSFSDNSSAAEYSTITLVLLKMKTRATASLVTGTFIESASGASTSSGTARASTPAKATGYSYSGISKPSFYGSSTAAITNGVVTIGPPAGTGIGHQLFAVVAITGTLTKSGWVQARLATPGLVNFYFLRRKATGSEPATYSFSGPPGSSGWITIIGYQGVKTNGSTPFDSISSVSGTNATNLNAGSVNTTIPYEVVMAIYATQKTGGAIGSITLPTSLVQKLDSSNGDFRTVIADFVQPTASATGTKTGTADVATTEYGAFQGSLLSGTGARATAGTDSRAIGESTTNVDESHAFAQIFSAAHGSGHSAGSSQALISAIARATGTGRSGAGVSNFGFGQFGQGQFGGVETASGARATGTIPSYRPIATGSSSSSGTAKATVQWFAKTTGVSVSAGSAAALKFAIAGAHGTSTSVRVATHALAGIPVSLAKALGASSTTAAAHAFAVRILSASASGARASTGTANAGRVLKAITSGAGVSAGSAFGSKVFFASSSGASSSAGTATSVRILKAVASGSSNSFRPESRAEGFLISNDSSAGGSGRGIGSATALLLLAVSSTGNRVSSGFAHPIIPVISVRAAGSRTSSGTAAGSRVLRGITTGESGSGGIGHAVIPSLSGAAFGSGHSFGTSSSNLTPRIAGGHGAGHSAGTGVIGITRFGSTSGHSIALGVALARVEWLARAIGAAHSSGRSDNDRNILVAAHGLALSIGRTVADIAAMRSVGESSSLGSARVAAQLVTIVLKIKILESLIRTIVFEAPIVFGDLTEVV